MGFLQKLISILGPTSGLPKSVPTCLRCAGTELRAMPSPIEVTFFECPKCARQFVRHDAGPLTERWLGPLSLVLYGVIFEVHPRKEAVRIAAMLRSQKEAAHCDLIAKEIRAELAAPTQPVREILPGMRASENDLREFLQGVADALDAPR